jgi:ABC-type Fe3+/spermidine/putrescine transport system ATPase subunit
MQNGKALQIGIPEEIYRNPINNYVAEITGEVQSEEFRVQSAELSKKDGFITHHTTLCTIIRPSQIRISPNANLRAIVESIKFLGAYYEVILKIDDLTLKMYSFNKLNVADEVGIEIKPLS